MTLSGRVMAKVVPAAHLARNMEKGVQFHGSAITDLVSDRHGNLIASGPDAEEFLALPDTSTFAVLPWAPNTGRFFCNLYRRRDAATDPGAPLATCVRTTLRHAHERFRQATGLELRSGCEPEMSWFGGDIEPTRLPNGSPAYHVGALEMMRPIVQRVTAYAQAMGLDMIEGDYEDTGQLELNFQYDRCDATCDRLVSYRLVCAQVAREFGVVASFMPKPHVGSMANGCHHNLSLWRGEDNVFVGAGPAGAAPVGDGAARAGRLARARAGDAGAARSDGQLLRPLLGCRPVRALGRQLGPRQPHLRGAGQRQRTARVQAARRRGQPVPVATSSCWRRSRTGLSRGLDPGAAAKHSSYDGDAAGGGRRPLRAVAADARRGAGRAGRRPASCVSALPAPLYDAFTAARTDEWERFCGAVTDWHREMYLHAIP